MAEFSSELGAEQEMPDYLGELGRLTQFPDTNIIKLPNISASVPQLTDTIAELREKGYSLPDYPGNPKNDDEKGDQAALRQGAGQRGESLSCAKATRTAVPLRP